jgi:hypothetical protein
MPIPKFTYIPFFNSFAALLTILSLLIFASPDPGISNYFPEEMVLNSILLV